MGKLLLNPWVILAVVVGLVVSHGTMFIKGHNYGAAGVEIRVAQETAKVRAEAAARNRKTEEDLRVLVDVQTKARLDAEAATEELRNALAADQTDTTFRVGPDLDRLFRGTLYRGRGGEAVDATGGGQPDLP